MWCIITAIGAVARLFRPSTSVETVVVRAWCGVKTYVVAIVVLLMISFVVFWCFYFIVVLTTFFRSSKMVVSRSGRFEVSIDYDFIFRGEEGGGGVACTMASLHS